MADIAELVRLLKALEDDLVSCTRCGMCQAVCPLYGETGRETDVARGKLALVENLSREILDNPEAVKERLDRCLLCGSCAAACPGGVPVLDLFLKARAIITGFLGLSPLKKAIFRGFLSNPDRFDHLMQWMGRLQGPFTRSVNETLGSSCARFMSPLIGDRHFMPIAAAAWHKKASRDFSGPRQSGRTRVVFYPGCLVDKVLPQVADAAMEVFAFHGVDVHVAARAPCCGIPALSGGDVQTFSHLVHSNIRIWRDLDFDYLVTPCATCTSTISKLWPAMQVYIGGDSAKIEKQISEIVAKTRDINAFLVDVVGVQAKAPAGGQTVTYHDPCHLKKSLGIAEQPRTLLAASGSVRLAEMANADRCCGMGGSFNLAHYELSKKIGAKKRDAILATGADAVATGCPACMLQIIDLLSHAGSNVAVRHPIEIYARALQVENKEEPS
ncbi:(Fe-S)-binding protein [Desulfatitalea alkaliphila]|uniref:Glycolate oxidase iron-sulfur subunit n=1 Tax=Desulfatitalea alkaliphila TaxID=2929485 RepID=A0AA41UMA7_9BACT|nr:(Fe-S)-binding protein [Desulfatitalea alkaliphila]MCJ8502426.1 (Fe-S)-binding protein [Desulfatitalea alkaliphila]